MSEILAKHGRPNSLWISSYLDSQYRFSRTAEIHSENFRINEEDFNLLKTQTHGAVDNYTTFHKVWGQRLAYIDALKGENARSFVNWAIESFKIPEMRSTVIRAVTGCKVEFTSDITAAFGGKSIWAEETLSDWRQSQAVVSQLVPKKKKSSKVLSLLSPKTRDYLNDLIKRAAEMRRVGAGQEFGKGRILSREQFQAFKRLLDKVRDGRVGDFVDRMTEEISKPGMELEPTLKKYVAMERELDGALGRPHGRILQRIGTLLMGPADFAPPGQSKLFWMLALVGYGCLVLASDIGQREMLPLFRQKHPRRLYGHWRDVKRGLELVQ